MAKFKKGQSGNPSGRPKGLTHITELCRAWDEKAIKRLGWLLENGEPHTTQVRAAEALLDRGWGRPPQAHLHQVSQGVIWDKVMELTADEASRLPPGNRNTYDEDDK